MKKLILSIIFSAFSFSLFAMQARVISTKGKAEVQNGSIWVSLKEGDSLEQGAVIQTGFKSEVVLKIKESTITVAPLSRITLQTLVEREGLNGAAGKDETAIFLDTGSLKSNVQKSADRRVGFTVRSPVATASVRGTAFSMKKIYRAVRLNATAGKVAFWKNTKKSERAFDKPSTDPVGEASNGNEPSDISDFAPPNAILVGKGEAAAVTTAGGMSAPLKEAGTNSFTIGAGTQSAANADRALPAAGAPGIPGAGGPGAKSGPNPGENGKDSSSLTVNIGLEH